MFQIWRKILSTVTNFGDKIGGIGVAATTDKPYRLIIDDVRTFKPREGWQTVYARTVPEAREFLNEYDWDEVWWDHDMGYAHTIGVQYESKEQWDALERDSTTYGLACELEANPDAYVMGEVFVHSANPYGGLRLMEALSAWSPTRRHVGWWDIDPDDYTYDIAELYGIGRWKGNAI